MIKYHDWINTGLIVILAILVLVGGNNQSDKLGSGTRFPSGLSTDATLPSAGEVRTSTLTVTGDVSVSGATVLDELTQGGLVLATSTDGTAITFKASDLLTYSVWEVTVNGADLTYTFPASSTLSAIIPNAGDSRTWTIINATSTAGIDVIFASGTGSAIKAAGAGGLTLDEDSHGEITLTRKADSDFVILVKFPDPD